MALSGSFISMSPTDLLQMLAWGSQTGLLTCSRDKDRRHVFLENGDVVGVTSSRFKDRFGAMLLRLGYITNEQFNDIFDQQATNGRPLGELFKSKNLLSEETLQKVLNFQAEELIYDLLAWNTGDFSFDERSLIEQEKRLQPVEIANLLLEGARRMDEINRLRTEFEDQDTVYKVSNRIDFSDLELNRPQQTLINMLMTPLSLGEIFRMVNESEYDIYTALNKLMTQKIVVIDRKATERLRREQEEASKLLDISRMMEEKGWFHEALSSIEDLLSKNPEYGDGIKTKHRLKKEIMKQAELVFASREEVPFVRQSVAAVSVDKMLLSPQEGFVFSRIDGNTSVRNLRYVTGMNEENLFIILHKFIRMGLISLDDKNTRVRASRL